MRTISLIALLCAVLSTSLQLASAAGDENGISEETTKFSLDLLKMLPRDKVRNVMFSPLGVFSLLAVLRQGSSGSSREQLDRILQAAPDVTTSALRNYTASIEQSDSVPSLRFMWKARIKGNHNFKPDFHQVLRQGFKPKFQPGKGNNESKPKHPPMKGILSKIVAPSKATSKTFAALANLLYMNGHWAQEDLTPGSINFSPAPGEQFNTPAVVMKKTCHSGVDASVGAKWIHLPLVLQKKSLKVGVMPKGSYWSRRAISLMVVLPTQQHGLNRLVQRLTADHLLGFLNYTSSDRKDVELTIPNFYINETTNFKPLLKKLGLRHIFESSSGLSNISTEEQLFVSRITQKGQFILDEFGARTEEFTNENFPYHYIPPFGETQGFNIDEPFLFFVFDKTYRLPLFSGKVSKPEPSKWSPYGGDEALQFPQY